MIRSMKKLFQSLVFFFVLCPVSAQYFDWTNFDFEKSWQEDAKDEYYSDTFNDSLFYHNRILLFRQTPLALKPGYTKLFNATDFIIGWTGVRGYKLTWTIRNDSLFIRKFYQATGIPDSIVYPKDTIRTRIEKFTAGRYINGLLFVEWISGDLRVISKNLNVYLSGENDDRKYGSILTVKNGLVVGFREDWMNNITSFGISNMLKREQDNEIALITRKYFVSGEPDTLYHEGKRYFFRRSPVSLKQGYTDVFHEDEVSIFNINSLSYILGLKGYNLTWVTRNDSLFISGVYPTYYDPKRPTLCKDTIIARMESFTGGCFKDGLLFVNWISGEFGLLTIHTRYWNVSQGMLLDRGKPIEDYTGGSLIRVRKGLIKRFDEQDNRTRKN